METAEKRAITALGTFRGAFKDLRLVVLKQLNSTCQ